MEIFIIRDGQQSGPFSEDAVQKMLADGSVRTQDVGWYKGLPSWLPLGELLKSQPAPGGGSPAPDAATPPSPTSGSSRDSAPMTAKQRAFLKYLGAEFGENVTMQRAAIAVSEALENPKLQARIRKWHDEKLRLHPDVFQDEIDFRKANRAIRYTELCQTEGAEVVRDVTKAHVQVLIESLDKLYPNWEAEPRSALWDYLFPSIGEHFPKLVRTAWKGRLKLGGTSKVAAMAAGVQAGQQPSAAMVPPPAPPSVLMAIGRGIVYGAIALAVIIGGKYVWDQQLAGKSKPVPNNPPAAPAPAEPVAAPPEAALPAAAPAAPVEKAAVPENPPEKVPAPEPEKPAPAPASAAVPTPDAPAPPPAPPMAESKPPVPEEKPAAPAPAAPTAEPKPAAPAEQPVNPPATASPPAVSRTSVTLLQGIAVNLANGQVTLPAGTPLKLLAIDGANLRVGWNNNVFLVPAVATDVATHPPATPAAATTPALPAPPTQVPAAPSTNPARKPTDDL